MEQLIWILIILCCVHGIISNKVAILNFQLVCYENSKVLNSDIDKCIPDFVICISNKLITGTKNGISRKKCPIYYSKRTQLSNKELNCSRNKRIRKIPIEANTKPVPITNQANFFVAIYVKQCNQKANFQTSFLVDDYNEFDMEKNIIGNAQSNTRLTIRLAVKLPDNQIDNKCKRFCETLYNDKICFGNNKEFCKTSQQQCSNQNISLYERCLAQTECKKEKALIKCSCNEIIRMKLAICTNTQSDFNRYKECAINVRQFLANTPPLASETRQNCENRINICKSVPCHIGCRTEYHEKSAAQCICRAGFSGAQCDIQIINFIWIPLTALVVVVIITLLIIIFVCHKKQGKKKETENTKETLNKLDSDKTKHLILRELSSNTSNNYMYQDDKTENGTYEDIDDEYLEPSPRLPPENESLMSLPKRDPGKSQFLNRLFSKLEVKDTEKM